MTTKLIDIAARAISATAGVAAIGLLGLAGLNDAQTFDWTTAYNGCNNPNVCDNNQDGVADALEASAPDPLASLAQAAQIAQLTVGGDCELPEGTLTTHLVVIPNEGDEPQLIATTDETLTRALSGGYAAVLETCNFAA